MKSFIVILMVATSAAFAGVQISIGQGEWICLAEGIKSHPVVARGKTRGEAEFQAKRACAAVEGSSFHCDIERCDRDRNKSNVSIDIIFDVIEDDSQVSILLTNGQAGHACTAEAFRDAYYAEAPTLLEAEVLVRQQCISDGHHGLHCDVEECSSIGAGNSGSIIGDLCGLFGKKC